MTDASFRLVLRHNEVRGYWWWVLKAAGNGAVLATSETYSTRHRAISMARRLADALNGALAGPIEHEDTTETA